MGDGGFATRAADDVITSVLVLLFDFTYGKFQSLEASVKAVPILSRLTR